MPVDGACCSHCSGGEGGIRTPGRVSPSAVFKTAAFSHSATSPRGGVLFITRHVKVKAKTRPLCGSPPCSRASGMNGLQWIHLRAEIRPTERFFLLTTGIISIVRHHRISEKLHRTPPVGSSPSPRAGCATSCGYAATCVAESGCSTRFFGGKEKQPQGNEERATPSGLFRKKTGTPCDAPEPL
jgi:hypothetical protein